MNHPKLKAFLPYLWLAWCDDLLTENESKAFHHFLQTQSWLTSSEKKNLYNFIDIAAPPRRETLAQWKSEIHAIIQAKPKTASLFALAVLLSKNNPEIKAAKDSFLHLENALGIAGAEAIAAFKSNENTLTAAHRTIYRFDPAKMNALLDGRQSGIISKVKTLLSKPVFKYETATDVPAYREKVWQWCQILAKEKLGGMGYDKPYGGGDIADYFAIMEALSYHDLSLVIKFGVQFGLWGMSVQLLGTEKHHKKYLKKIASAELPGCFAMTETRHGSNVKSIETTATYNAKSQTFTIHTPHPDAQKEYIGNAALHGQMATVFAQLLIDGKNYGVNAFIVPLRDENGKTLKEVAIADCGLKMGLNGVDNGTIRFENVIIPKENMLDRFASVNDKGEFESPIPSDNRRFFTMLGTLVGGRIGIPRSALSAAKSGLAIAIRYSDQRRQFGPENGSEVPILNYRIHQRRLLIPLAQTYALHFALQHLTDRYINRKENQMQEIEALAAGMKAHTSWFVRDALQECREACGGKGYLSKNRIDRLKNDTEIYTTFEGDNTVLMQLVAKSRLSEFRKKFGEMSASGMIGYIIDKAKTAVVEKNPIAKRNTEESHLLDPEFHLHAFIYRETITLESAARRLKKLMDSGIDPYDAFNIAQHQIFDVSLSYLERVTLEQFQQKIKTIKDKKSRDILEKLYRLYALSQIEKHKGWYLEANYMEAVKTKAIRKIVNQLCWDIRPDAIPLIESFGIPDVLLAAPIAVKN